MDVYLMYNGKFPTIPDLISKIPDENALKPLKPNSYRKEQA